MELETALELISTWYDQSKVQNYASLILRLKSFNMLY